MRQFLLYVALIFSFLFLVYIYREDSTAVGDKSVLKVYASGSFISEWGPGPELKKAFEKKTGLKIQFKEMSDPGLTLQKMNMVDDENQADVILGLDQFDLVRYADKIKWKNISDIKVSTHRSSVLDKAYLNNENYKNSINSQFFIPYDWSAIAFVKKQETLFEIKSLDDLLNPELKSKIAFEDPRTSSPGLQFLMWVARSYPEDEAIEFLKKISRQAHSFSPSWSTAYGLFKHNNTDFVLSYITSPIYHLVEEKDSSYRAMNFEQGLPLQIEFAGLIDKCIHCDVGMQFVSFVQSSEAQSIIMKKNYMLPIDKTVVESTAFDTLNTYNFLDYKGESKEEINKWLRIWSEIKKNEI